MMKYPNALSGWICASKLYLWSVSFFRNELYCLY